MFGGNFAPAGWMFCDGSLLPISENETLFNLIGTTYGGDGQSTFALPDLQGRIPIHPGNGFSQAEAAGVEDVTLTVSQIPGHQHPLLGSVNAATSNQPSGTALAASSAVTVTPYGTDAPSVTFPLVSIGINGGSQPHANLQPYLCVNFIISLFGIFPSPT
jgi:microcystin-dependent protein